MDLNIKREGDGNIFDLLGIDTKRADELIDWVRHCWMSYNTRKKEYTYNKLLRVTTKFCNTPEEIMIVGHILGRLFEQDCSACPAKKMLATVLAGIAAGADITVMKIPTGDDHATSVDNLKERIKKDVN
jgi:hypothetical protein